MPLTPVDYDPFAQDAPQQAAPKLTPVDYDPFAQTSDNPGFLDRVGSDFQKRQDMVKPAISDMMSGQQGPTETLFQVFGKGPAGFANDVIGEGLKSAVSSLPEPVKQAGSDVLSTVGNTAAGRMVGSAAEAASQAYDNFAQNHPRAARDVEAALNIGGLTGGFIPIKGKSAIGAVTDVAKQGLNNSVLGSALEDAGGEIINSAASSPANPVKLTREQQTAAVRKSASGLYQDSKAEDIAFNGSDTANLNSALTSLQPKTDLELRAWNDSGAAKKVQDITESLKTETPTLNGLLTQRNDLNSKIKVATRAGNDAEAYRLTRVKDALDQTMMSPDTKTWQLANHQWAQQAVLGDTDEIVNKALTRAQPANSLDTAINNYLGSYKSNGLSDKEWQALKDVTTNSSFDKLRKGAASGLLKFTTGAAGAHFGPAGSAAGYLMGHYGSEFLKDSAMAAKIEKLDKFRDMVMSRKPPEIPTDEPFGIYPDQPTIAPKSISDKIKMNRSK